VSAELISRPPLLQGDSIQTGRLERDGRPIRVVVAEDESVVALDLQTTIQRAGGAIVGIAIRGQDAITLAAALRPDVVLMDVHLVGDLDGVETAKAIKALRGIGIVFVTAHADAETMRRMFDVVSTAPVIKPISDLQLREAIIRACH